MSWPLLCFSDLVEDVTSGNKKIKSRDYLDVGILPVIDQGKQFVGGFINDTDAVCNAELPVVIFGDHTRVVKYVDKQFALGADGVKILKPSSNSLDEKYLYHFLKQARLPKDAGYSRHFKFVKRLKIPLPPLKEQKRIAAILDKADALRRKRQQAIDLTDQLLRSIFLEMFGDPVTNPKGWDTSKLSDVAKFISGGTPRKNIAEFWGGGIFWVSPKDMKSVYIENSQDTVTDKALESGKAKLIPKNSVLCVTRSGILKHTFPVGISATALTINQDLKALIPSDKLNEVVTTQRK